MIIITALARSICPSRRQCHSALQVHARRSAMPRCQCPFRSMVSAMHQWSGTINLSIPDCNARQHCKPKRRNAMRYCQCPFGSVVSAMHRCSGTVNLSVHNAMPFRTVSPSTTHAMPRCQCPLRSVLSPMHHCSDTINMPIHYAMQCQCQPRCKSHPPVALTLATTRIRGPWRLPCITALARQLAALPRD
jgi:hypothetical protein